MDRKDIEQDIKKELSQYVGKKMDGNLRKRIETKLMECMNRYRLLESINKTLRSKGVDERR